MTPFLCFFLPFLHLIPTFLAESRRRSGVSWLLVSLLISPLLATIILVAVPKGDRTSV